MAKRKANAAARPNEPIPGRGAAWFVDEYLYLVARKGGPIDIDRIRDLCADASLKLSEQPDVDLGPPSRIGLRSLREARAELLTELGLDRPGAPRKLANAVVADRLDIFPNEFLHPTSTSTATDKPTRMDRIPVRARELERVIAYRLARLVREAKRARPNDEKSQIAFIAAELSKHDLLKGRRPNAIATSLLEAIPADAMDSDHKLKRLVGLIGPRRKERLPTKIKPLPKIKRVRGRNR